MVKSELPLVVIMGPTASGKTDLAIRIAQQFNGEVISADSRTIYKDLTIGTAKPTYEQQSGVAHWGFDIVEPSEVFSAAAFQSYARARIAEIRQRGHLPILVGGSGLYVDSVLYNYEFPPAADKVIREKFEQYSLEMLHNYCAENNIMLPSNKNNKRYVINAIARNGAEPKRSKRLKPNTIAVVITTNKAALRQRIDQRVDVMIESGVVDEAKAAATRYGWGAPGLSGIIYPLIRQYIEGQMTKDELVGTMKIKDWQLAKRQITWLKRHTQVPHYSLEQAEQYLIQELAKNSIS